MLRYISTDAATVFVESDEACEVEILGRTARTFRVDGRHYALVVVDGLEPDSSTEYQVQLDGERVWPPATSAFPPSRIQTLPTHGPLDLVWGSCRVTRPQELPYTLSPTDDDEGVGVDALYALTVRVRDQDPRAWPRMLLLIGDQVYADQVSPETLTHIRARRETDQPPGEEIKNFEEYTWLYREAWSQPALRWLFSTIPSAMIFDDHDVTDDWNTSESWLEDMRVTDWWQDRITGGLASYWIYQHIGNLSPDELAEDELYQRVIASQDAAPLLHEFAVMAEREGGGSLWSFSRMLTGTRLVVIDGREGRVLSGGTREMIDANEFGWLEAQLTGDYDHVLIANTLPVLLAPTLHYIEAWNEALCDGVWGKRVAAWSEKLRRGLDLEHWAAFQDSFRKLIDLVARAGAGQLGHAPAAIVMLGGDVHQAYLEHVAFRRSRAVHSSVWQAVCSPFRNQLSKRERLPLRIARRSRVLGWLVRRMASLAGVQAPEVRWRVTQQPTWKNQLGWLRLDGRRLWLTIESTRPGHEPELEVTLRRQLA